ncbi:glycosyltransferase [Lapillicoccus sp.]|uniref:glycosyltransferase n=1 Tax=Lapillicoccus sp. TaxID=1909287 RepID=UPI003265D1CE
MSRPLRVVHVITSLTTGGAERQLELLVARSANETATIALYAGGPVADSMRRSGQRVDVLGLSGWRRFATPFVLASRLRAYRPDVVHVHLLSAQLWGIPAARLAGTPVVVSTEHSLMDDTIEGRPHTWWLRLLYRGLERMTTRTVAVSETTSERLQRWGVDADRITVSDNGIDFDGLAFDNAARWRVRRELDINDDTVVVGAVGRLDKVKRLDTVVRACAPLLHAGRVLVVAGTGPLGPQLRQLGEELGVSGSIRWLGARDDVSDVLSATDVLVSASGDETFGMAVVEGVANGLPVVYVQCPALEELSTEIPSATRLPAPTTSSADAEALRAAVESVASRLRRWPVPTALVERYGADAAAARVDDVHAVLVAEGSGRGTG